MIRLLLEARDPETGEALEEGGFCRKCGKPASEADQPCLPSPRPVPRYRCHKIVSALQIEAIEDGTPALIHFIEPGYPPVPAAANLFTRYTPARGDYWVVYDDGYQSVSPKAAFEAGYTRIFV